MPAQVLHGLRFFSLIGPCRPHPEQRPGGAARAKQAAHTGPSEVRERTGKVRPQELHSAALHRRQHEPHTGPSAGRAATGRSRPQSVQGSALAAP
ncbi:hypothetical protein G3I30_14915 [Actinospica acidiphila]|nr:hypothetical protein [Actinospica acidiphila]